MSERDFLQGFACALAALNRGHDEPTMVCSTMRGYGLTLDDFRRARVEKYDLDEIRKCLRQGDADDRAQTVRQKVSDEVSDGVGRSTFDPA